jgi:hypothetical protein
MHIRAGTQRLPQTRVHRAPMPAHRVQTAALQLATAVRTLRWQR